MVQHIYEGGLFMSKILITSIGSGSYDKKTEEKKYNTAKYYKGQNTKETYETAYIYEALLNFYGVDKIILVGTAGSNWHMLYEHLRDPECTDYDTEYSLKLLELYESADKHEADVCETRELLEKLKETVDKCVDIVVMKYGLNEDEILSNFELLSSVSEHIKDGDGIYFDITHSFRSLAIYELLAVSYFKDVLRKNVSIEFISYGMLEFSWEKFSSDNESLKGCTPIVNLSQLGNLLEWIKAAEEYKRFGTTYLLADLLGKPTSPFTLRDEELGGLRSLGDGISANNLSNFKTLLKRCDDIKSAKSSAAQNVVQTLVLKPIFEDISRRFSNKKNDDMLLQMELANWHYEKRRYIAAAITAVEAIIDYCSEIAGLDREIIRKVICKINGKKPKAVIFCNKYNAIRLARRKLAHREDFQESALLNLGNNINDFSEFYRNNFAKNEENKNKLCEIINEKACRLTNYK
jgi:CRISPR-associated Csx2 family protein